MDTTHCAVDGWVDAIPVPGPRDTATFDLVVRPADIDALDDDAPDTIVTCTSGDPRITHELLTGIQPGDLLRATGTLVQPSAPGDPARLTVDALEVLDTALVPVLRDMVIDRFGDYVVRRRPRPGPRLHRARDMARAGGQPRCHHHAHRDPRAREPRGRLMATPGQVRTLPGAVPCRRPLQSWSVLPGCSSCGADAHGPGQS
ncbi:hypothetical protein SUDANB120_06254 (plasmid) [Streptomyces sp. enrichment culture]|uniref:hypothetical protein n=1 Tax=Streptomyces sp. enrichment culture TaxID=1795815 RepID=UPI003F57CDC0